MNELVTSSSALKDVFSCLAGTTGRNYSIPILKSVHVEGDKFTCTNLDLEVQVKGAVKQASKDKFAFEFLPLKRLLQHIDDDLTIKKGCDGDACIEFNGAAYKVPNYDSADFPFMEFKSSDAKKTQIDNLGLLEALKAVQFAISTEQTRYYLNGVCFSKDAKDSPCIVATNGKMMAAKPIDFMPEGAEGKILPTQAVKYLISRKISPKTCEFLDLNYRFNYPGLMITGKLIDGVFPDLNRVIPTKTVRHFTVDRKEFSRVIKRIVSFRTKGLSSPIKIEHDKSGLCITSNSGDDGSLRENLDAEIFQKDFPPIGFNARYLNQIADVFSDCEKLTFKWAKGKNREPAIIRGDASNLTVVCMPMMV